MATQTGVTGAAPELEARKGVVAGRPSVGGKLEENPAEVNTTGGETTTDGETTSGETTTTTKKKKKGKNKGEKKRKRSKSDGSKKKKKKGKKKDKKKKKKKQRAGESEERSQPTDTGPKYTDEDVATYVQKRNRHRARVREQRLIDLMKRIVCIVPKSDPRWNKWTEAPLWKFIRDPDVQVVTIFFSKIVEKKAEKKLLWAEEDDSKTKNDGKKDSDPTKVQEAEYILEPRSGQENSLKSKEVDPLKRYDDDFVYDQPLGSPPPAPPGVEQLIVINEVQANNSPDLFYFVKVQPIRLDNNNFYENCTFGNLPVGGLGSLHALVASVHTPIFYEKGVLPDSVKNDFSSGVNKLMTVVTEASYRMQNQTMLHVPKEVLNMPVDVASRDKELCSRLKDAMIHWIRQIKEVLSDQSILDTDDWTGPLEEIAFWETRCADLRGLTTQIRSQQIRMVRDIMQIIKSPYLSQFTAAADEILEGSTEAISNLHYLSSLREPCEKMHASEMKEIPDQLKNILWIIRVIWLQSPYYNTRQKLNGLVRKVSNELILKCKQVIDVEKVFNGYIESSEVTLQECLSCLTEWKKKYFAAQKMHSMNSYSPWLLEYDKIFNYVDAFVQRIRDLLEICVCQRLYARRVEGYQEELPDYPGTRAPDITRVMKEVQKMFDRQLRSLYNYNQLILDVRNASWHEHMIEFRAAVKDMEMMVQNVLMSTFDSLSNIEACCQLLETFYYYRFYQRDIIARAYDKLTVKLYKLFETDTIHVKNLYAKNILPLPLVFPQYAGRGAWAMFLKRRIDMSYEFLHGAWWLPECGLGDDVVAQYKILSATLGDFAKQMHTTWVKELGTKDLTARLGIPLMCRSTYRPGMIEVNFDKIVHRHLTEAEIWSRLDHEVPEVLRHVYHQSEKLHNLRETVLLVVKDYNRIVAALSVEERSLFKERIKLLDRKIYPGMHKLTWLSDVSDSYINDCRMAATKVQGYTNDYKNANIKIGKLAMKISSYLMVRWDPTRVFEKLEFNDYQTKHRERAILKMAIQYKDISLILRSVFEMFRSDGQEVKQQWFKYLETIDEIIQEALCINIRRSLEVLRRAVVGGELRGPPPPIFKLDVVLVKNRLEFNPSLAVVKDMLLGIFGKICYIMKSFPRVVHFLSDEKVETPTFSQVMANDEEARATQLKITEGVNNCISHLKKYRGVWDVYRDIWEINKDLFVERYEKLNPSTRAFDSDLLRYAEVANIVQAQENIMTILFCILDCSFAKRAICEHSRIWQGRLCKLLFKIASKQIMGFHIYINENVKKFAKPPETIPEMVITFKKFRNLVAEVPEKEKEFPSMVERFDCLKKHEYELGDFTKARVANFNDDWIKYQHRLKEVEFTLKEAKERLKKLFVDNAEKFKRKVSEMVHHYENKGPYSGDVTSDTAIEQLGKYRTTMNQLKVEEAELQTSLAVFDIDIPQNMELKDFEKELPILESVWEVVYEWDANWDEYRTQPFRTMQAGDMEDVASYIQKKLVKLALDFEARNWGIINFTKNRVDIFKRSIPVIHEIKNPALRQRHWDRIFKTIGAKFNPEDDKFTFDVIVSYGMEKYADEIIEIVSTAQKELVVENTLRTIRDIWVDQKLDMVPYKDKGPFRLKSVRDLMQNLEDHSVSISAMKGSRFAKPFEVELIYWEKTLALVNDVLEIFLNVQRQYIYLENIFMGEDIRKQLPTETKHFDEINDIWKEVTQNMAADSLAIAATQRVGLIPLLKDLSDRLDLILKSLEIFLESKRQAFPRFYFISNDDLLEILGNSRNPEMVQPHLKKLFDNIHKIRLTKLPFATKYECQGMISGDGEYVEFGKPFTIDAPVEIWLTEVETNMRLAVKQALIKTRAALKKNLNRRDRWIRDWPGQAGITSAQIQWTTEVTRSLYLAEMHHVKNPLKKNRKSLNKILDKYSIAISGSLSKIQRLKIVAMVTIEIHNRDTVDKMYRMNCRDMNAFEWLQQLRFYWEKDINDCMARQTNTFFVYGYEYLGNSGRLVVTPLTDRCYITLTTALFLHRGGSPKGPAGTGKTETTKDLGKNLGIFVIVVNCSEGLDYKSMGKMFSGLSQTGAWGCFDEFNRINIEVLSVVAQQIMCILQALSNNQKRFFFEGYDIRLIWSVGIFITMNPGYAGRTELPDNLKAMFRPISMIVPDTSLIAEIVLFGEGFRDTRVLARKVDTLYSLAKQQLSKQDHYDFGLRSMVALLRYAGQKRRQSQTMTDSEVLILAMRDMNIPRLTTDDVPLFSGVIKDLFPNDEPPVFDYGILLHRIKEELIKSGNQPTAKAILKCLELYNTKNSRHSVMIVGRTGSGKSVTWRTLRDSMTSLAKENEPGFAPVKEYIVNPKALDLAELYGEFDLSTNEWADGVISAIMRITCVDEKPDQKWILFDGPVDAVWIENMNSVMDDNKILTLINSERISMPEQVSLLFEVDNLAVASPATVSRCGMVYNDYRDLGWKPYIESWLARQKRTNTIEEYRKNIDAYLEVILDFKTNSCKEIVAATELNLVIALTRLMDSLATKENGCDPKDEAGYDVMVRYYFIFSLIWSVCVTVDEDGRKKIDAFFRETDQIFPDEGTIYDYFVDPKSQNFVHWDTLLPSHWKYDEDLPFFKIVVPTVDTVRYNYVLSNLLKNSYPVCMIGPVGTGKTSVVQSALQSLDPELYAVLTINMSSQTTSNNVQSFIESRMERRAKGLFGPAGGKSLLTFMDDFNMPEKDIYGSQPPLELVRQWLDYKFWYDRQAQTAKLISNMILVAAMGPPGGGRTVISPRLQNIFSIINMTFPEENQIKRIFLTMLKQKLHGFEREVKSIASPITMACIDLYNSVAAKMLPTPNKTHYLFNLRDISRIFQGLLRSNNKSQDTKISFTILWFHECARVFHDRLVDDADRNWLVTCLAEKLGTHLGETLQNVCPNRVIPVFGDFMNTDRLYEEMRNMKAVRKFMMESALPAYNATPGSVPMNLVLFREAIEHVARIARVISQPKGNMLIVGIGGHGRQSLSRLATYICEFMIFEIEVNKRYRKPEFREDIKLYRRTGCDNKSCCFIMNDTQIVESSFLEDLNNILSSGEVPNLYKPDEWEDVKSVILKSALRAGYQETNDSLLKFLLDRVQSNLHVILCMSPIGDSFRHRVRQYPALVNCTTIDWFNRWPKEALLEVAHRWLHDVVLDDRSTLLQDEMRSNCAKMFAKIHFSVTEYCQVMQEEMKRHNYVTPINYLELVAGYKRLLAEKRLEIGQAAARLRNGLSKIIETRDNVEVMQADLEASQRKLMEYQRICDSFLNQILKKKTETDIQAVIVAQKRERVGIEEKECIEMARVAFLELEAALPALDEAMAALAALNKKDLSEVKSYSSPPPIVGTVMEAVMVLRGVPPSWGEAKKQLGNADFLKELQEFDKDNITDKTLLKLKKFIKKPDFLPELVGKVSTAAKSLCIWVRAMELYGRIYNSQVAPKKAKLDEAKIHLAEKQRILAEAEAKIRELEEFLDKLRKQYEEKMAEKDALTKKAEDLMKKLDRAAMLVDGLAGERVRWEETIKFLGEKMGYVVGDCLLAAACLSYIGPFLSNYRDEMVAEWLEEVRTLNIPCAPDYSFCEFLSYPTTVRLWNIQGLPRDSFSTENGVIVTRGMRTPLMIDPQCQALKWIKNMESGKGLKIIDLRQPNYLTVLEGCIVGGIPCLLKDVGEELDHTLAPVLSRSKVKQGDKWIVKLGDKELECHDDFRFYVTTKISNPHYIPEIASRVCIVNFAVKEQGLEAQLLGIVVRREKPELEEMKNTLVVNIASGKKKLEDLEDTILRLLDEAKGSILEHEELAVTLKTSKETSVTITQQVETAQETEIEIDAVRENYRSCATRASILFFVLFDMSQIDPMYQFSLEAYISLFNISIEKSPRSPKLDVRINHLNEYHTYAVYRNICRALFEKHKLLFALHMCVKIIDNAGKLNQEEYQFFLKGGVVLDRIEQMTNPCEQWLSEVGWDNITELDKVPNFRGIVASFEQYGKEWHIWYTSTEPEKGFLPSEWENSLNDFQKMIIIRALRPDRVTFRAQAFVANNLGTRFTEPPVLDMHSVLEDSTALSPLIFVLSSGADPAAALFALAEHNKMMHRFFSLSLGQGQAPFATKMILEGAKMGHWVFLANCHLSLSWMPDLDKLVETVQDEGPHKDFRLWLSSSPHPDFPLSILQAGIKMTTEPPKGIKANMKRLYQGIAETRFINQLKPDKFKKLLFALCFFHAILLERKKFQQLGWNIIYGFNDSDFEVSELLLGIYLAEYEETPWDALKYLIAGVMYGGHVTDDWDRRLLESYINQYFCEDAIQLPFYKLSELPNYYIPKDGDVKYYREIVNKLPPTDHPEAFGQHTNADIASQINEANLLFVTLLSLQVQKQSASTEGRPEDVVALMAAEVMAKLPATINEAELRQIMGETINQPLNIVLIQEIARYNVLLGNIRRSLIELDKGIQGLVVMSTELEEIFKCIFDGRVPSQWLKAYPSMKSLGAWSRDLSQRVEQLAHWSNTLKPPVKFWLSGFTFPTGFLTAVLQTTARKYNISIDSLSWEFSASVIDALNILVPPKDGVYVQGLFLEGASWDIKACQLCESAPMQLVTAMPVVHFRPVVEEKKKKYLYEAPCYYYPNRAGGQGRPSYVVTVDLRGGSHTTDHWTQRGVALLMSLAT